MSTFDGELGIKVGAYLLEKGLETPMWGAIPNTAEENIENCHRMIMQDLGLNLKDDSLVDTPKRVAKMYCRELFSGLDYKGFPKCTTVDNKMNHDELVIVKDVDVLSMCEHHFIPFVGTCSVGYIPSTKVLGLSKIPRVTDFFCRRPQIQERLTAQIHGALCCILDTLDVAVVIRAEHMCMRLRGVKQSGKETITSKLDGKFFDVPALREEFLMLTRK
jgi:GTP cyclohydrolase I